MSHKKLVDKKPNFGKTVYEKTKELIRQRALGRVHTEETKAIMSQKKKKIILLIYMKKTLVESLV